MPPTLLGRFGPLYRLLDQQTICRLGNGGGASLRVRLLRDFDFHEAINLDVVHFPPVQRGRVALNATVCLSGSIFPSFRKDDFRNVNCEGSLHAKID